MCVHMERRLFHNVQAIRARARTIREFYYSIYDAPVGRLLSHVTACAIKYLTHARAAL